MVDGESPVPVYLDHNVNRRLAEDLRRHGVDAIHAAEVGNQDLDDDDQLAWAAAQGRAILSFDLDDFPVLAARWFERGADHAGIILSVAPPRVEYNEVLRRMLALLATVSAETMTNQVLWLDRSW